MRLLQSWTRDHTSLLVSKNFHHHLICRIIIKEIYEERYKGNPGDDPIVHLKKFEKRCDSLKINNVSNERIKVMMFPYSLAARSLDWFLN
jgi:hypothetical protein